MKRLLVLLGALALLAVAVSPASADGLGPPGGMFYANDQVWRSIIVPNTLPPEGAFDTLYMLGAGLAPVADASPGSPQYNGGRWEVRMVTFAAGVDPVQFTNADALLAAAKEGDVSIGPVVTRFECPLIRA